MIDPRIDEPKVVVHHVPSGYSRRYIVGMGIAGLVAGVPLGYAINSYLHAPDTKTQHSRLEILAGKNYEQYSDAELNAAYNKFFELYGGNFANIFSGLVQTITAKKSGPLNSKKYHEFVDYTLHKLGEEDADIGPLLAEVNRRRISRRPDITKVSTEDLKHINWNTPFPFFNDPEMLFKNEIVESLWWVPQKSPNSEVYTTRTGRLAVKFGLMGGGWIPAEYFEAIAAKK